MTFKTKKFLDIGLTETGGGTNRGTTHIIPDSQLKPLEIRVSNGDIKYANFPVLAGHFLNDGLFSVEKAIDRHLNGELNCRMKLGLYPGEIGTYEMVLLNEKSKDFPGTIIMGLGQQGKLNMFMLARTVEQAIAKYLTRFNHLSDSLESIPPGKRGIGITSSAIGSGYGGLSLESSLRAIIQGVQQANFKIHKVYGERARLVGLLDLTEMYEEKAIDYIYILEELLDETKENAGFIFRDKKIIKKPGARKRLPVNDTSDWWTRIEIVLEKNTSGIPVGLKFVISTDAARQEERTILVDIPTAQAMLEELSSRHKWSVELSRAVFEMLVPVDFKEQLGKQNNLLLVLDKETAVFPWELLQDNHAESKPLSVNSGMIRQLITPDFRTRIEPVVSKTALVVADPLLQGKAPQLDSAYEEGGSVNSILEENGYDVVYLPRQTAGDILVQFHSKEYKIMHFACHGVFNQDQSKPTGIMIGPESFITTTSVKQKTMVPEMVFVNCCYSGAGDFDTEFLLQNRHRLAANIGTQLIDIGVKAVVVAGWAINDDGAKIFAETFYHEMFKGEQFGSAVQKSRSAVYDLNKSTGNTWGGFQCYGDPFYTLTTTSRYSRKNSTGYVVEREAEIELHNLLSKFQTGDYDAEYVNTELQEIIEKVANSQLQSPAITEGIARLFYSINNYPEAIKQYGLLMKENDASFTLGALELFCNIKAMQYQRDWQEKKPDQEYLKLMQDVVDDLDRLMRFNETADRLLVAGNTMKRLALIQTGEEKVRSYRLALENYTRATEKATRGKKFQAMINMVLLQGAFHHIENETDKAAACLKTATETLPDELKLLKKEGARKAFTTVAESLIELVKFIYGDQELQIGHLKEMVETEIRSLADTDKELFWEQLIFLQDLLSELSSAKKTNRPLKLLSESLRGLAAEKN